MKRPVCSCIVDFLLPCAFNTRRLLHESTSTRLHRSLLYSCSTDKPNTARHITCIGSLDLDRQIWRLYNLPAAYKSLHRTIISPRHGSSLHPSSTSLHHEHLYPLTIPSLAPRCSVSPATMLPSYHLHLQYPPRPTPTNHHPCRPDRELPRACIAALPAALQVDRSHQSTPNKALVQAPR